MMKKLLNLLLIVCSASTYAQDSGEFFNHIKLGFSKGFKAYGLNDNHFELKDENFTSITSVDIHIYKNHSIYGEFINQPLIKIRGNDFPTELDLFFYQFHYDAYIRSRGFCIGYRYTREWIKNLESSAFFGLGRSYLEIREYYTNKETLKVSSYDIKDTVSIVSAGIGLQYILPNNLGFNAEASLTLNSPVYKLGIIYKLKSK